LSAYSWRVFFYGLYLTTFGSAARILLWHDGVFLLPKVHYPIFLAALGMFAFGTMNVAFAFYQTMNAFVYFRGGSASEILLSDLASWPSVLQAVDYSFQTLIGDSILIYRCFVVYNHNRFVVAPSIVMSIGSIVCGIMVIWREATLPPGIMSTQDRRTLLIATLYGLCSTAATNVLTTTLIVYRI